MSNYSLLVKEFTATKEELGQTEISLKRLTGRDVGGYNGSNKFKPRESATPGYRKRSTYGGERERFYDDRKKPRPRESPDERDYISDNDDSPKKTLQSTVVAKFNQTKSRKAAIDEMNSNAKIKARNRRMFGSLLVGTLSQFEKEEQKRKVKDTMRTEIEKKIDDATRHEKEKLKLEKESLFHTRRAKKIKLRILEKKIERAESYDVFESNYEKMSNFIMTKTKPEIFFLPASHVPATKKCLEETKTKINELIDKKKASFHVELNEIEDSYKKDSVSSFKEKESNGAKEEVESQDVPETESESLVVEQEDSNPEEEEESTNYRSLGSSLIDQEFEPIYD